LARGVDAAAFAFAPRGREVTTKETEVLVNPMAS
jgi:hypothetical protein